MANHEQRCPKCGAPGDGQFCGACGAAMAPAQTNCEQCQVALSAGAQYCHRCGRVVSEVVPGSSSMPWIVAGTVVVALVVAIGFRALGGISLIAPDMANSGNQGSVGAPVVRPPDISQMTPRERFDRLFARVMDAGAQQDSAVVMDFTPMALGAYNQLEVFDQQARYRAALIRLQVGEFQGAAALADTILADTPHHLLGLVVAGTAASFQGDTNGLGEVYREFLDHYDTQLAAGYPEYTAEQAMIESFREAALAGTTD
jgi:hypothetical protein